MPRPTLQTAKLLGNQHYLTRGNSCKFWFQWFEHLTNKRLDIFTFKMKLLVRANAMPSKTASVMTFQPNTLVSADMLSRSKEAYCISAIAMKTQTTTNSTSSFQYRILLQLRSSCPYLPSVLIRQQYKRLQLRLDSITHRSLQVQKHTTWLTATRWLAQAPSCSQTTLQS